MSPLIRQSPSPWLSKKPYIINNEAIINGKPYKLERIPGGSFHAVYKILHPDNHFTILKTLNQNNKPANPRDSKHPLKMDIKELEDAEKYDIPYPKCFIRPDQYQSSGNEGGFFEMEYIPHPVDVTSWKNKNVNNLTTRERNVLDLVKFILNLHIKNQKEIAPDFIPRNVMVRDDDTPVVVDMYHPDPEMDLEKAIEDKIKIWGGENPEIEQMLHSSLPSDWKTRVKPTESQTGDLQMVPRMSLSSESPSSGYSSLSSDDENDPGLNLFSLSARGAGLFGDGSSPTKRRRGS